MNKLPTNEKFVIFLNPRYFKKSIFKSFYDKLKENLENKGITIYNIKTVVKEIKRLTEENEINVSKSDLNNINTKTLLFDDYPFPSTNTLYIHLFNGLYYNDNIYINKKVHYEREMLFLLAAALGVQSIEYKSEITETTIFRTEAKLSVKKFKNGVSYSKTINRNFGLSGREEYSNNGSPILINSSNMKMVENKIKEQFGEMSSNIFNIDFYKNNPKLESFVYKRVHYKMDKLEYNIESEDISDISFSVKSSFMEYGLNIAFDKNISCSERLSFLLIFYTYDELKKENIYTKKEDNDEFVILKQYYNKCENEFERQKIILDIIDYIMQISEKCGYYTYNNNQKVKISYAKKFYYYLDNNHEELEKICINFHSTNQIKTWISKTLDDMYNDINLNEVSNVSNGPSNVPLSPRKYESVKRRISNMSINDNSIV
jgi:hypothetical protein